MKEGILKFAVLLLLMAIVACAPKVIPVAVSGSYINEKRGSISIEKNGLTVTAEAGILYRTPYNLEDYFTPFRVTVRNESGQPIDIGYDDFILIDEQGNQHKAYSPEKITEIIKSDPDYVLQPSTVIITSPGFGNFTGAVPPYPYGSSGIPPYERPYYDPALGRWVYPPDYDLRDRRKFSGETLMQDIYLTSLPVGEIIDGAQVFGNVYFKADTRIMKSAKVRVTIAGTVFELPFLVK